ncbi:MAG: hypothetical protein Q7T33_05625 [Dehalococcoidia bacterium]|nr:hypothetical protein [Dehalococcoidia bacterium]
MTTNRGRLAVLLVVAGVVVTAALLTGSSVLGLGSYRTAFVNKYNLTGTKLNSCDACHVSGDTGDWNTYGDAVKGHIGLGIDPALTAVENLDSDGDGATNIAEINAHTWPGDAADFPAGPSPSPTTAPSPTAGPTATPAGRLWGDFDCQSGITIGDAQKIARDLVDIPITQGPGCPAPGAAVTVDGTSRLWGDLDCQNGVTIGDAQKTARDLVDLPVSQAAGCPAPGAAVQLGG